MEHCLESDDQQRAAVSSVSRGSSITSSKVEGWTVTLKEKARGKCKIKKQWINSYRHYKIIGLGIQYFLCTPCLLLQN